MAHSIDEKDDYSHAAGKEAEWRESYYFNFVSSDKKSSGFTTIGILPNQLKKEFIFAFFYDNKQIVHFREEKISTYDQARIALSDNTLTLKLIEPMKKWNIHFKRQDLDLQIEWNARFAPFNFGEGSGTSWSGHFEQSGSINGEANLLGNRIIPISGYSQRDKSWGPRNWHIEKWFALHAQFETEVIGLRKDVVNGISHTSGGLTSEKEQIAISEVEVTYELDQANNPLNVLTNIKCANGKTISLRSKLISPKSFVKFSRNFEAGSTELFEGLANHQCITTGEEATGLIEFLFTHKIINH